LTSFQINTLRYSILSFNLLKIEELGVSLELTNFERLTVHLAVALADHMLLTFLDGVERLFAVEALPVLEDIRS